MLSHVTPALGMSLSELILPVPDAFLGHRAAHDRRSRFPKQPGMPAGQYQIQGTPATDSQRRQGPKDRGPLEYGHNRIQDSNLGFVSITLGRLPFLGGL